MNHAIQQTLQFYATAPYPCSYLPGQVARSQVATPGQLVDTAVYSQLVERGFRRSGLFTYRPHCDQCQACQSLRIPVHTFTPNRSQRRTWKQHQSLQARLLPPQSWPEHFALYQRYLAHRHADGGMDHDNPQDYAQFLLQSRVDTRLVEFCEPPSNADPADAAGPLRIVSVIDVLTDGLSAVYTFYDPHAHTGYGTYAILWLIELTRRMGLHYLYLGYWIADSPKMAYKTRFQPCEIRQNGNWHHIAVHNFTPNPTK